LLRNILRNKQNNLNFNYENFNKKRL